MATKVKSRATSMLRSELKEARSRHQAAVSVARDTKGEVRQVEQALAVLTGRRARRRRSRRARQAA